jgi:hypothetical protein
MIDFLVFNTTFSNISAISWRPVLVILRIQHYAIKFVSDLRQVDGLLRVHRFPPPIKLTAVLGNDAGLMI